MQKTQKVKPKKPQKTDSKNMLTNYFPGTVFFENLDSPISLFDGTKDKFMYINSQFSGLTGYTTDELYNISLQEYFKHIHANDLAFIFKNVRLRVNAACRNHLQKKKHRISFTINYRLRHKQGHYIHVNVHNTVLEWNPDKERTVNLNIYTDITKHKNNPVMYFTIYATNPDTHQSKLVHEEEFRPFPQMLTIREAEILKLMTAGMSAAAIAGKLDKSYYTIRSHWRTILSKTACNSQGELKDLALAEGWI